MKKQLLTLIGLFVFLTLFGQASDSTLRDKKNSDKILTNLHDNLDKKTKSLDSTMATLDKKVDNLIKSPTFSIWIPFLSALIGGFLVLIGQHFDRKSRRNTERINGLREIYAYCRKLEALMKNNYRELAIAKAHVEYCWYCNATTTDSAEKKKYYEEHLKSQETAREIERRIGETKADFIGHVRKFQAIKELKTQIEKELEVISDLANAKAKAYDLSISHDKVRNEMVEKNERELAETYDQNLKNFKDINNYLYTLLR